jgi:hypothetical protein
MLVVYAMLCLCEEGDGMDVEDVSGELLVGALRWTVDWTETRPNEARRCAAFL